MDDKNTTAEPFDEVIKKTGQQLILDINLKIIGQRFYDFLLSLYAEVACYRRCMAFPQTQSRR
jgi:hypothetical protein